MLSGISRKSLPTAALLAGLLLLPACSSDDAAETKDADAAASEAAGSQAGSEAGGGAADPDLTVIAPGRPGEPATTTGPQAPAEEPWNHPDVAFAQMMIPHHGQALTMSKLAETRAADPGVRRLAERIEAGQRPEILVMAAWLDERGIQVPRAAEDPTDYDHGDHGHNEMQGMLTPQQMKELEAASGPAFDRLFLRGMIRHHEGAIAMAQDVARDGEHVRINEMAADIVAGQQAEITRMRAMLAELPAG